MSKDIYPPHADELEISIFGPGYGEALAIHLGNNQWLLVDSCLNPQSKTSASLHYLQNLNVDVKDAVKLIVATHWHDDHIRGLGQLVDVCSSARSVLSSAFSRREFKVLLDHYSQEPTIRSNGLTEMLKTLSALDARDRAGTTIVRPKLAIADRRIYQSTITIESEQKNVAVSSLSPSDAAVVQALTSFSNLIPKLKSPKRRIIAPQPNHSSVVLWCEIGEHRLLLGADLECTSDTEAGWIAIVNNSTVLSANSDRAKVFKIPHHGSQNGHEASVWTNILLSAPFALRAARGNRYPACGRLLARGTCVAGRRGARWS